MRRFLVGLMSILLTFLPLLSMVASAADKTKDDDRLRNCGTVLREILDVPDDIPQDLLDKADCVVVFPSVLKAAFIFGGSYGRGVMSCRRGDDFKGIWGAPTMMALEGGSFGLQIGGEATDFVLLVMNERGASAILASKVKLGADASVAAGPVGRDSSAESAATLRAEILSYSRARGVFAGLSLEGSINRTFRIIPSLELERSLIRRTYISSKATHLQQALANQEFRLLWRRCAMQYSRQPARG
jgi:lipid-binding SYLF domain-containing protein